MPNDIRSYFSTKPGNKPAASKESSKAPNDDAVTATKAKKSSKRRIVDSSDDEEKPPPNVKPYVPKKTNLGKLTETSAKNDNGSQTKGKRVADVKDIFGSGEMVRIPKKKAAPTVKVPSKDAINSDEELELSIIEYEKSVKLHVSPEKAVKQREVISPSPSPEPVKEKKSVDRVKSPSPKKPKLNIEESPRPAKRNSPKKTSVLTETEVVPVTPENETRKRKISTHSSTARSSSASRNESSAEDDEDRHKRKQLAGILYQKFKNRSSVLNPGCKPLPKGKPNCLRGLTFVITGIMESLERDEMSKLINEYGGKVVTGLSHKVNYMVTGEEAGPLKLAKAEDFKIKLLSEDELFEMINKSDTSSTNGNAKLKETSSKNVTEKKPKEDNSFIKTSVVKPKDEIKKEDKSFMKTSVVKPKDEIKKESNSFIKTSVVKPKIEDNVNPIKKENSASQSNGAVVINTDHLPWVEKYKPTSASQIIGQQGAASNYVKLKSWLEKWHVHQFGPKKPPKPNPWAKNDDGAYYKAVLLSGPPGVGKTTSVGLVCKELGLDTIEFNASDTRSKKLLQVEVAELLSNQTLRGYFHGSKEALSHKHVLVMDEVDGMAGNEDRGGIQELIALIKNSSIPIICMCNDRNHQKMRSLVNYCYDLRFNKPRVEQIKGAMMSILFREKFKVPPNVLNEIIAASNNDIRQTLNHLSLLSSKKDSAEEVKVNADSVKKDLKLGPWDVVRKVFSADEHKTMSIQDKSDLFFYDYSLGPLFVQQNYLGVAPNVAKCDVLTAVANAADALSMGDLVEKRIRSNMAWSLLPVQAMFSSVLPGEYMSGRITSQINFPGWLGKNSKTTKRRRLAQEVHDHTRVQTSASATSFRMDYAPLLLNAITTPLIEKGLDGVRESLDVIKTYRLLREDIDALIELSAWPGTKNTFEKVDSKVKAALTRTYNKEVSPYSYTVAAAVKKKRAEKIDDDEMAELEGGEIGGGDVSDDEEDDKVDNDVMIKAKKAPAKRGTGEASSSNASSSKGNKEKAAKKVEKEVKRSKKK